MTLVLQRSLLGIRNSPRVALLQRSFAGREDIDVRMLGKGRPFIMEIQNQKPEMPGHDYFAHVEQQLQEVCVQVLLVTSASGTFNSYIFG